MPVGAQKDPDGGIDGSETDRTRSPPSATRSWVIAIFLAPAVSGRQMINWQGNATTVGHAGRAGVGNAHSTTDEFRQLQSPGGPMSTSSTGIQERVCVPVAGYRA